MVAVRRPNAFPQCRLIMVNHATDDTLVVVGKLTSCGIDSTSVVALIEPFSHSIESGTGGFSGGFNDGFTYIFRCRGGHDWVSVKSFE